MSSGHAAKAVSPDESLVRYARPGSVDNDAIDGSAFHLRPTDEGALSVYRPQVFSDDLGSAMIEIRRLSRITLRKGGRYVQLPVRDILSCFEAVSELGNLTVVEDPLPAEGVFRADPSHALVWGLPPPGDPLVELAGDLLVRKITKVLPAT